MTFFLSLRTQNVGGAVRDPVLMQGDGTGDPPNLKRVPDRDVPRLVAGLDLLFAVHGFNVSLAAGAFALGRLDQFMALSRPSLMVGVLWPGDAWLPVVDYPFEGDVAIDCGNRLAAFCNNQAGTATSISFVSHSLGARVVLQAMRGLIGPARSICLTAAAINDGCFVEEYADTAAKSERIALLASRSDLVLKLAFAVGDPFADLLHDDHSPFERALGSQGPAQPPPTTLRRPWQIPDGANFGHGDYLPGNTPAPPAVWPYAANFMKRAFLGQPQPWPPS